MEVKIIHNSDIAYDFLKSKIRYNYIYQFSNLSAEEWKTTICYGLYDNLELKEISMLKINYDIPVLLTANFENSKYNIELIKRIKQFLPYKFYTHIDKETLENVFNKENISEIEEYMNMGLCNYDLLDRKIKNESVRISISEKSYISELIKYGYPEIEGWLDDKLISLNRNFGIFKDKKLISYAGIHAYSEDYAVAAVAYVTTHPDFRKMRYAEKVVIALSKDLKDKIKYIGLNVRIDNLPAIKCYKRVGFEEYGKFIACKIVNQ